MNFIKVYQNITSTIASDISKRNRKHDKEVCLKLAQVCRRYRMTD